jgi:hypothetical protein
MAVIEAMPPEGLLGIRRARSALVGECGVAHQ